MNFHHVCILTDNYKESLEFYKGVFQGCVIKENKDFHGRDYNSWITIGDIKLELQTPKRGTVVGENSTCQKGVVHIAFFTEDTEAEYARLLSLGVSSFLPKGGKNIYTVMGERLMKLRAPEGTIIEIRDTDIGGEANEVSVT